MDTLQSTPLSLSDMKGVGWRGVPEAPCKKAWRRGEEAQTERSTKRGAQAWAARRGSTLSAKGAHRSLWGSLCLCQANIHSKVILHWRRRAVLLPVVKHRVRNRAHPGVDTVDTLPQACPDVAVLLRLCYLSGGMRWGALAINSGMK
jgi:hypothetical protein